MAGGDGARGTRTSAQRAGVLTSLRVALDGLGLGCRPSDGDWVGGVMVDPGGVRASTGAAALGVLADGGAGAVSGGLGAWWRSKGGFRNWDSVGTSRVFAEHDLAAGEVAELTEEDLREMGPCPDLVARSGRQHQTTFTSATMPGRPARSACEHVDEALSAMAIVNAAGEGESEVVEFVDLVEEPACRLAARRFELSASNYNRWAPACLQGCSRRQRSATAGSTRTRRCRSALTASGSLRGVAPRIRPRHTTGRPRRAGCVERFPARATPRPRGPS